MSGATSGPAAVAVDQGTTSTRALLWRDGRAETVRSIKHAQHCPGPGMVEHDPLELARAVAECANAAGADGVMALANQGESCLAWDARTKEPLSMVIVWQDMRTRGMVESLRAEGAEQLTRQKAGLPLDPYFSASKLRWLLDNTDSARELLGKGRLRLGTTDAFFLDRLAGRCLTDVTTASRTSLMNIRTARWDAELCDLFGVPAEALPEIVPTVGDFGRLGTCDVRVSIVDQQAALYGHGCREPGDVKMTFGTGAFALAVTGAEIVAASDRGLLTTVAWQKEREPPTYALDGGVYNAGSAVDWAHALGLFQDAAQIDGFERLPAIDRGLVFVPALSGLACPHWDRGATGVFLGLSLEHDRTDMIQAVLEGVALRGAELARSIGMIVPARGPLSVDGGLSRNRYFVSILATALGRQVRVMQQSELTALGALELCCEGLGGQGLPGNGKSEAKLVAPREGSPDMWRKKFAAAIAVSRSWRRN